MLTPAPLRRFAFILLCVSLAGCGSDDNPLTLGPSYIVSVTPPNASTTLGTAVAFTLDLTSTRFTGPVALTALGAPASWQVAFSPSDTVNLTDGGTGSTTMTVTVPSDGEAMPSGGTVTIHATASAGDRYVARVVTVRNEYIVPIVSGTGAGAHWGSLAGTTIELTSGVILTFRNDDAAGHRIHTNDVIPGLLHQTATMGPGGVFSDTLGSGSDIIYCHDHLISTGQITINAP